MSAKVSAEDQEWWAWYWSAEPDSRGMAKATKKEPVRLRLEFARAILNVAGYLTEAENTQVKQRLEKRARLLSRRTQKENP